MPKIPVKEIPPGLRSGVPVRVTLIGIITETAEGLDGSSVSLDPSVVTIEPVNFEGATEMAQGSASRILTGGIPLNGGGTTPSQ
jgi:hypothetical protein